MINTINRKHFRVSTYFFLFFMLCQAYAPLFAMTPDIEQEMTFSQVKSGHLLFQTEQKKFYKPALLLNTDMHLKVNGLIAMVNVKQHFKNTSTQWMEGIYVFPLPENAAVNKMRIQIGERIIEGEIKEKQAAKVIYQKAKANGQQASLVEQERPNLFTNSIANIAPGEEVMVEISYLQNINYEQDKFSLRFPMTITPRYIPGKILDHQLGEQALNINQGNGWAMNTVQVPDAQRITPPVMSAPQSSALENNDNDTITNPITITGTIDMAMPLREIVSPFHPINIKQSNNQYQIELTSGRVSMDRDFVLEWTPVLGQEPKAALFSESKFSKKTLTETKLIKNNSSIQDNYLMLMMMPPQLLPDENRLPREMIFIIDTSGSMSGMSIRQAKESLQFALTRLSDNDQFNIIEFNSKTHPLFTQSVTANKSNIQHAQNFVSRLNAKGRTEMAPALMAALNNVIPDGYLRQVVFMTDGSVGNESHLFSIIHENLKAARLFTIGIGSAPNSYFMRKSAQFGRGSFTNIASVSEVKEKMSLLFQKLEAPVISHLKIQWPQGSDVYPKRIPDLYMGEPLIITAQVPELKGEVIIEGQTQQGVWQRTIQLSNGKQHEGVGTLWARNKISSLMDEQIQGTPETWIKPQIINIAIKHQLLSKYTSFIAVDKTPVRTQETELKQESIANARVKNQKYAFPKTATPAMRNIMIGLLLLSILFISRKTRLYEK